MSDFGRVLAIVGNLNRPCQFGDVLLPGAIQDDALVLLSLVQHSSTQRGDCQLTDFERARSRPKPLPAVGTGRLRVIGGRIMLTARYNNLQPRGRAAFRLVERMGAEGRWSLSYDVLASTYGGPGVPNRRIDAERVIPGYLCERHIQAVRPFECSLVPVGAAPGTRTLRAGSYVDAEGIAELGLEVAA